MLSPLMVRRSENWCGSLQEVWPNSNWILTQFQLLIVIER
ncbi:hypothetical protein QE394_001777 [Arthrobacter sp. SORGH_AS 212]|nr:hypothetical protein [Arthrobacter sp. SORGH_AS_0212]